MYKIGVIGDKDSILGFKAMGFSVFQAASSEEAEKILHALAREDYAVIYITEQIAAKILPVIDVYKNRKIPAIIPIPGNQGSLGIGIQGIKKSVEKAVGANILFTE
ncbi:MAG: V-type ATP synthase subunit F [Firmicutes bacterium]|nr:V-type ATP synthase subunit F [Bacillota bacterium]